MLVSMHTSWRSQPTNLVRANLLTLRATVFCFRHRLSKHKMTRNTRNLEEWLPAYAYARNRVLRGLKFFVRSRRNLRNLARSRPAPAHFQPASAPQTIPTRTRRAPHSFGLKPAAVRKLLKTHD